MPVQRITPTIAIGAQPTEAELEALKGEGFVGVVNLRSEGEEEPAFDPSVEGEIVRALGMDYLHREVASAALTEQTVDEIDRFLENHAPGKVLVHCRKGKWSAALVLLLQAKAQGWPPSEIFEKGRAMGLTVEGLLRSAVETYLARVHRGD